MGIFDKINSFLNSSCLNWSYIVITFFIILLVISQISLLIDGLIKAFAGRFALDFLTLFFTIIGKIYDISGIEATLSCPKLDTILSICRYVGWFFLFMQAVNAGFLELIGKMFWSEYDSLGRYFSGLFKVFLIWIVANVIGMLLGQIMNEYIRWLCNCVF
jgi:hypothetical protein